MSRINLRAVLLALSAGLLPALVQSAEADQASLRVDDLRCEYLVNPLGIDVTRPRLSWKLESIDAKARGQGQTAYRIRGTSPSRPGRPLGQRKSLVGSIDPRGV